MSQSLLKARCQTLPTGLRANSTFNVASATDIGVGTTQVGFTLPMSDTNYAITLGLTSVTSYKYYGYFVNAAANYRVFVALFPVAFTDEYDVMSSVAHGQLA